MVHINVCPDFIYYRFLDAPRAAKPIRCVENERGCHIAISHSLGRNGYPVARVNDRVWAVHRKIYVAIHGPLSSDVVVRHTCDDRECCNPEHLVAGTHAQNVADRVARSRSAIGRAHGKAKLTERNVIDIRASSDSTCMLARRFGVNHKTIADVRNRVHWKHVA